MDEKARPKLQPLADLDQSTRRDLVAVLARTHILGFVRNTAGTNQLSPLDADSKGDSSCGLFLMPTSLLTWRIGQRTTARASIFCPPTGPHGRNGGPLHGAVVNNRQQTKRYKYSASVTIRVHAHVESWLPPDTRNGGGRAFPKAQA